MKRAVGRKVFTVDASEYRGEDVVLAGYLTGEMDQLERRLSAKLTVLEQHGDPDEVAVDEVAEGWRYERDLLAADDLEDWLRGRSLGFDEWTAYLQREVWAASEGEAMMTSSRRIARSDVAQALFAEAVCSGTLDDLSYRLAAWASSLAAHPEAPPCPKSRVRSTLKAIPSAVRMDGLLGLGPEETMERAEHIACLLVRFEALTEELTAPAALEREVSAHALEWTQLDCEIVTFPDEGQAREAAFIVRQDGLSLGEAAALAHVEVEDAQYRIEDVDQGIRDRFVSARPGQLVGPVSLGDTYTLVSVLQRSEPSVDDPVIQARARDRVVARTIEREVTKRVRWHDRF